MSAVSVIIWAGGIDSEREKKISTARRQLALSSAKRFMKKTGRVRCTDGKPSAVEILISHRAIVLATIPEGTSA